MKDRVEVRRPRDARASIAVDPGRGAEDDDQEHARVHAQLAAGDLGWGNRG